MKHLHSLLLLSVMTASGLAAAGPDSTYRAPRAHDGHPDPREQLVVMMQAAETRAGNDAMSGWQAMSGQCRLAGWVVGKSRTQRGMWSFTVVMGHPLRQHRPNMPFIERNQPIETLAPDRPNEAFTVRVLRSGPDHQPQQVQKVSEEGERRSEHVWR